MPKQIAWSKVLVLCNFAQTTEHLGIQSVYNCVYGIIERIKWVNLYEVCKISAWHVRSAEQILAIIPRWKLLV